MGDSPSCRATQDQCGRVAHTPITVYCTRRVQWLKQAPIRDPLPLRLKEGADLILHVLLELSDEAQNVSFRREVIVFDQWCEIDAE